MSQTVMKKEERIAFELRSLYQRYGYLPYKMGKFEEYDLYVSNKEFLVGDGVVTFTDTNGKLLALKPDVTLSIIKNDAQGQGKRKVYYNENVYRISQKTKRFKELMQVGLECFGDVDGYDVFETVLLATKSLACISPDFVLDISHSGIVSAVLKSIACGETFSTQAMKYIADKNAHETEALCKGYGVSKENTEKLLLLIGAYGKPADVLKKIAPLMDVAKEAYEELKALCESLESTEYADKIRLDFSVSNDMAYYDNVVFKGFVDGIAEGVLSGGRYDKLMSKMGKKDGAIGFAVYLDLFEGFGEEKSGLDVDTLVLYTKNTPTSVVVSTVEKLVSEGKSVRAQTSTEGIRYKELVDVTEVKA